MRPHPSLVESSWLSIFYLHLWILLEKLLQFIVQMCIQLPVFQKKNLTCYTKPYIFISLSVKVLHVSVHTRFGTFHQCADQKFSRLLWFSFLTAAKIFLYCTTVHPALCPNIIAIKNVQMLWNLEHFQQFFFFYLFFGLNGILKSTKSLTRFESIRFLGLRLILNWLKSPQNQGV